MRRREFIAGLGVAAAWPIAARAQQRTTPVVGILGSTRAEGYASRMAAFMQGLKEAGFVPGQNVVLEQRWANDQYDRLPEMAADLVRAKVSLIAAIGNNLPTRAAKAATSTIPIVFAMGSNSRSTGSCCQPQPARRKRYRRYHLCGRTLAKAVPIAPRPGSER